MATLGLKDMGKFLLEGEKKEGKGKGKDKKLQNLQLLEVGFKHTTPLFLQDDLLREDFKCSPSHWLISSFTSKLVVKSANGQAYGQFARGQKNDLPGKP